MRQHGDRPLGRPIGGRLGLIACLAIGLILPPAILLAQPALEIAVTPREVEIGDPFDIEVSVTAEFSGFTGPPRFPVWAESWGEAEIVRVAPLRRTSRSVGGGGTSDIAQYTQTVTLQLFRLGTVTLPPIEVNVPLDDGTLTVVSRQPIEVEVQSALPESNEPAVPRPVAPPESLPIGSAFWFVSLALLLACTVSAPWLLRYRGSTSSPYRKPPLAEFHERLRAADSQDSRTAHTIASFALRDYLGGALGWPGIESTTAEITARLRISKRLDEPLSRSLEQLLQECDAVKFAHVAVTQEETTSRLLTTAEIAEQIAGKLVDSPATNS